MSFDALRLPTSTPREAANRLPIQQLVSAVNMLQGSVGAVMQRAVRVGDLVDAGILELVPEGLRAPSLDNVTIGKLNTFPPGLNAQSIFHDIGWKQGKKRYSWVLEANAAMALYAYDVNGFTPVPVMNISTTYQGLFTGRLGFNGQLRAEGGGGGLCVLARDDAGAEFQFYAQGSSFRLWRSALGDMVRWHDTLRMSILGGTVYEGQNTSLCIARNIGAVGVSWVTSQLELANTDGGNVGLAFHRSGFSHVAMMHSGAGGLEVCEGGVAGGFRMFANGDLTRGDANDRGAHRYQPRFFIQNDDPGPAARYQDVWIQPGNPPAIRVKQNDTTWSTANV